MFFYVEYVVGIFDGFFEIMCEDIDIDEIINIFFGLLIFVICFVFVGFDIDYNILMIIFVLGCCCISDLQVKQDDLFEEVGDYVILFWIGFFVQDVQEIECGGIGFG